MKVLKFIWWLAGLGAAGTFLFYALAFLAWGLSIISDRPEPNLIWLILAFFGAFITSAEGSVKEWEEL